ncbi:MAG: hypothetical protein WBF93_09740 [Pirellulales bacterium]|jgi:hypothetical protein
MTQNAKRGLFIAAGVLICLLLMSISTSKADNCGYSVNQLDLFHNYYAGPGVYGGGVPARMYLSPRPTPPWVGHTYITYQPLMPHEMMYKHQRTYVRNHPDGSATRTKVLWY